jgi:hypothetical protein
MHKLTDDKITKAVIKNLFVIDYYLNWRGNYEGIYFRGEYESEKYR